MPEVRLDLDLAPKLVLHARLQQLALHQNLERDDEAGVGVDAREVHVAELAAAQRSADVEVC